MLLGLMQAPKVGFSVKGQKDTLLLGHFRSMQAISGSLIRNNYNCNCLYFFFVSLVLYLLPLLFPKSTDSAVLDFDEGKVVTELVLLTEIIKGLF